MAYRFNLVSLRWPASPLPARRFTPLIATLIFAVLCLATPVSVAAQEATRPVFAEPRPLPPGAIDLRIPVAGGGRQLAATLYVPAQGAGPFPALITAHGASSASRNQSGWQQIAAKLSNAGFALLVYDPPGTGDTPGEWREGLPLSDGVEEIISIADYLSRFRQVRSDAIGVIGWSRGGWTGPMAVGSSPHLKFFVGISAPSVSPNLANIHQRGEELLDDGFSADEVASINAFRRVIWDYYGTRENFAAAAATWKAAYLQPWFKKIGLTLPELASPEALKSRDLGYYEEGTYDPAADLAKLTKPILVILGSADRHIPIAESIDGWRGAFAASGNSDAALVVLAGAGHGMKLVGTKESMTARDGHMSQANLADHPEFMPTLLNWLSRRR